MKQRTSFPDRASQIASWKYVDTFGMVTRNRELFFVCVQSGWSDYEGNRLWVASTPIVFDYHFISVLRAECHSQLFCIAVEERCVSALLSISFSVQIRDRADYLHVLKPARALPKSVILVPLLSGVHFLVADIRLYPP